MTSPVRIIFLDFDGVLNSTDYAYRSKSNGGLIGLDPQAGMKLQLLAQTARADVVVSSTWRLYRKRTELCDLLRGIGYTGRVLGKTPDLAHINVNMSVPRGAEIEMWMRENARRYPVESFVILDDDSDMTPHQARHVKTHFAVGLTFADVDKALAILKEPVKR